MKTYQVGVREVYVRYITVEAEDAHDAREKANEIFWQDDSPDDGEYDYTLGWDEWPVWDYETGDIVKFDGKLHVRPRMGYNNSVVKQNRS